MSNTENDGEQPPVPRYGEYAPPGWVSPVTGQQGTPGPVDPPAAPPVTSNPNGYAAPQYLPQGQVPPAPAYPAPVAPGGPRKRQLWDLILTIILLVLGLFGAGGGVLYGFLLGPGSDYFTEMGLPLSGDTSTAATILTVSHIVLYLAALAISIVLLIKKRIAFYVPLAAGVIAAIIFWSIVYPIFSDPALIEQIYNTPVS